MLNQIDKAKRLAQKHHAGQMRRDYNLPYIVHVGRVASYVEACLQQEIHLNFSHPIDQTEMGDTYIDTVSAAWGHDLIEDTNLTRDDLLAAGITTRCVEWIEFLTNPKSDAHRKERHKINCERFDKAPDQVKLIKVCDIFDNINDLIVGYVKGTEKSGFYIKYLKEKREQLNHVAIDAEIYRQAVMMLDKAILEFNSKHPVGALVIDGRKDLM